MPAGIRIDADTALAERFLRRAVDALDGAEAQAMFDEIGATLVTSTVLRFEHERGPDGRPWIPSRRALEEGGQTLTKSARLKENFEHRATPRGVDVGTNVVYAAIHQFGSGDLERPKNIPARPFLGLDDDDADAVLEIARRRLAAA